MSPRTANPKLARFSPDRVICNGRERTRSEMGLANHFQPEVIGVFILKVRS